jgi:putative addiction module killer protein
MNTFLRTAEFDEWLLKLRDQVAKARILARIRSAEAGNFGDCEPVGNGISEMRIHVGAGYRIYFVDKEKSYNCFSAVATNPPRSAISKKRSKCCEN